MHHHATILTDDLEKQSHPLPGVVAAFVVVLVVLVLVFTVAVAVAVAAVGCWLLAVDCW